MNREWVLSKSLRDVLLGVYTPTPIPGSITISHNLEFQQIYQHYRRCVLRHHTQGLYGGVGLLYVSLSLGWLDAFFEAHADFLINYKLFHSTADVGVSVGVSCTLDTWIMTNHFSAEVGAQLELMGPPFSGFVHVNFYVYAFDALVDQANMQPMPALPAAGQGEGKEQVK